MGVPGAVTAGAVGPVGRPGPAGAQGPAGPLGAQGPVGVVDRWTSIREFMFEYDRAEIQGSDTSKVSEIAAYVIQNPSLQVGIDGSMDPRGSDPRNQDLSDRRVSSVRNALIEAGVPAYRIRTGAFGDTGLTRDRRVDVLVRTSN